AVHGWRAARERPLQDVVYSPRPDRIPPSRATRRRTLGPIGTRRHDNRTYVTVGGREAAVGALAASALVPLLGPPDSRRRVSLLGGPAMLPRCRLASGRLFSCGRRRAHSMFCLRTRPSAEGVSGPPCWPRPPVLLGWPSSGCWPGMPPRSGPGAPSR